MVDAESAVAPVLVAVPDLDPFANLRKADENYLGEFEISNSAKQPITWNNAHSAKKVFGYLKTSYPNLKSLLAALIRTDIQGRFFIPNAQMDIIGICRGTNIEITTTPYDLANLEECDLTICHGGHSTLLRSILSGVPTLLIPLQQEQLSVTQKAVTSGVALMLGHGISAEQGILSPLSQLLYEDSFRRAARECATRHQNQPAKSALNNVAEYVESFS